MSLGVHTNAHMGAHSSLGVLKSAHTSAHGSLGADMSTYMSFGAHMSTHTSAHTIWGAHTSAHVCRFLPRERLSLTGSTGMSQEHMAREQSNAKRAEGAQECH